MKKSQARRASDSALSRGIIAIVLLIIAIIVTLSFFDQAGPLGYILNNGILSFLFGSIRFITPIVLITIAFTLLREADIKPRAGAVFGGTLFFLTTAAAFHIHFPPEEMWDKALNGFGGGVFGMSAWLLKTYLGNVASVVLLGGLSVVSFLLLFQTAINHLYRAFAASQNHLQEVKKGLFTADRQSAEQTEETDEEGEEEEEADEYDESEENIVGGGEEEEEFDHSVTKKTLATAEPEEEEEADDEEDSEETAALQPSGPWAQKVVIKELPSLDLLSSKRGKPTSGDVKSSMRIIQDTFSEFGIMVDMGEVQVGPTVTQYTVKPHKGVKVSRITGLANDLALALAAHPIRIEAPIPGKSLIGIEVPNEKTAMVTIRELLESDDFQKRNHNMMIALGKDVAGKIWFADLPRMPHLLVAGATGSGKTVCVNTIILSLLYQNTAETLRMIMIDPKRVELTLYNGIPHLLTPVITNTQKTVNALKWTISEMERRFEVLAQAGNRDIQTYNERNPTQKLPYIVFIIDELADLMATAANDVEAGIIRLAQMARAVGIHLIVATQRPSVDVITGLMKANIPGRIAFSVASAIDSRTILDAPGAESLLGRGDMLLSTASLSKPVRIQGAFVSEDELKGVVENLRGDEEIVYDESIVGKQTGTSSMFGGPSDGEDPLFEEAKREVVSAGKASASFLQRRLKVGYARAARLLDELEATHVIGPGEGAKPREILITETEIDTDTGAGQEHNVFRPQAKAEPAEEEDEEEIIEEEEREPLVTREDDEDRVS